MGHSQRRLVRRNTPRLHRAPAALSPDRMSSDTTTATDSPDRTFRLVLYDALASEAMGTLTTGVFLVGYAVGLGASNVAIGVLAAVPFAVQFLQLPAVVLVERLRRDHEVEARS